MLSKYFRFMKNPQSRCRSSAERFLVAATIAGIVLLAGIHPAETQGFSSGSNGADGALNLTTPGTILFDPRSFNPPLNPAGDNVFNFTTINIGAGVTVQLSGKIFSGPVFWLASGPVQIDGTIDLTGGTGHPASNIPALRVPSIPGAGGYAGGVGGGPAPLSPAQPGNGPGGGAAGTLSSIVAGAGTFTGNQFLVPLVGGSGAGGSMNNTADVYYPGGGAGGGALLIASSASITIRGGIRADGGVSDGSHGGFGSAGSGGAIRLVAPTISGNGLLSARGQPGFGGGIAGDDGRIRLEAFADNFTGDFNGTRFSLSSPFGTFVPTSPTSVRVVSVAGVPVPPNPMSSLTVPDATINSNSPVTVAIEAHNIPLGTVVTLRIFSENGPDQLVNATPLAGTLQLSTATATVTFPSGFTRGFVRATWTQ